MEHVDPITGATDAWEAFVASLDPTLIEHARYRKPGPGERPGSHEWNLMVLDCGVHREAFYSTAQRPMTDEEIGQVMHEAAAWERRHEESRRTRRFQIVSSSTNPNRSNK